MAERKPVVLVGGQLKELPDSDTLPPQAPASHSHATSDVTGLDAALAGKASAGHGHAIGDVSGLQSALDAKQATLVSGTNIKTLGGVSLLEAGDIPFGVGLSRSVRTSNTILGTADKGKLIDITSGTFSQTFDAVATLGDGWWCYLRNSGTGDVTLDPNSTELIDGLASYVMYPGEVRLVQCDGVALRTILLAGEQIMVLRDEKTVTTQPGNATSETWVTRTLNTVQKNTITGASLSSNQVTLPAGTYAISARVPSTQTLHKARLYNVTGSVAVIVGSSAASGDIFGTASTDSVISGAVTLSASTTLRIEHWNNGGGQMGAATGVGSIVEVYSEITIRRLA